MTVDDLFAATGIKRNCLHHALRGMVVRGAIVWVGLGRYRLTMPGDVCPPHEKPRPRRSTSDGPRARLWRALRAARKGSVGELVRLVLRDSDNAVSLRRNAAVYLRALERAGYLIDLTPPGKHTARYSLMRDTGPLPPVLRAGGVDIRDRNTGETFRIDGAAP